MNRQTDFTSFKLAGLRVQAATQAGAQRSGLVRAALYASYLRKTCKNHIQQTFRRLFCPIKPPTGPLQVLVHIRGGIGDVAMSRVLVLKLRQLLPLAQITFAYDSKAVTDAIFSDGLIDSYLRPPYHCQNYDIVLSGCHFLMYDFYNRPRIEKLAPHFLPILEAGLDVQSCFKLFARYSPHLDGALAEIAVAHGGSRITNLGWFSGLDIHQNDPAPISLDPKTARAVLDHFGLNGKKYITIHDGINLQTDTSRGIPTRCWPEDRWQEFCQLFKTAFPDILIVQLGGAKSRPFKFVDVSLVDKTALSDLPYLLDNAQLHIDGESGMVHLAHLTRVLCVVLFGPSKAAYLGYQRNCNISAPDCGGCMNIRPDWMTHCLLQKPREQQCLMHISAQEVATQAIRFLKQ
ncbi:MAG: hypothetical protein IKO35_02060 [Elusimicrobiaceae bacterium]|nr:hypothetical protein [Elusimicrobiaceae bacterium]